MKSFMNRKSRALSRALIIAVIGGAAVISLGDQVTVQTEVNVKSDTNDFANAVETVGANTRLEVISKKDGWLRVRTPSGKEGFISEGDLPVNSTLASVQGNGQTNGVSNDAALRGLTDDAKKYSRDKNWSTAGADQMIAQGDSITDNDLVAFGKAGHVGPAKFRQ